MYVFILISTYLRKVVKWFSFKWIRYKRVVFFVCFFPFRIKHSVLDAYLKPHIKIYCIYINNSTPAGGC